MTMALVDLPCELKSCIIEDPVYSDSENQIDSHVFYVFCQEGERVRQPNMKHGKNMNNLSRDVLCLPRFSALFPVIFD